LLGRDTVSEGLWTLVTWIGIVSVLAVFSGAVWPSEPGAPSGQSRTTGLVLSSAAVAGLARAVASKSPRSACGTARLPGMLRVRPLFSKGVGPIASSVVETIAAVRPLKTLRLIREGSHNIRFTDAVRLAEAYGFSIARVRGSHHILSRPGTPELVNLQEVDGMAKPYQLRQLLSLVERYNLKLSGEP
jgi:hypothetical protein